VYPSSRPARALAVLCALLLSVESVSAQQGGRAASDSLRTHRMSLTEILERFESSNLDLRLARQELVAARARAISASARPNPGIAANREQLSGGGEGYHETVVTLGQTVEIGGQRGLRLGAAGSIVDAAESRVSAARLGAAFEVHRAYVRAAAAEADLTVLAEATGIFREVDASGRVRFAEGDISRFDRSRLQIERVRYENLLAGTRLALEESSRELTMLVAPDSLGIEGFRILPAQPLSALSPPPTTLELSAALLAASSNSRSDISPSA
jgi:outer membrane protein, heavy metal efflux system